MDLPVKSNGKMNLSLSTTEDRVAAYLMGKLEEYDLQAKDKEQMSRWLSIWQKLNNFKSPQEAINEHLVTQKSIEKPISLRTAWADYRHATKVWGEVAQMNQKARFTLLYEYGIKVFNLCKENGELGEMNRSLKNLIELASKLEDGQSGVQAPALLININVPGDGVKTIDLDDFKNISETKLDNVIRDIDSSEVTDEDLKTMLDGCVKSDKPK